MSEPVYPESLYEECLATCLPDNITVTSESRFVSQPTISGFNMGGAVTITFDPPGVEVDQNLDWNTAAKCFWNAVHRMAGKPAPFPDAA